MKIVRPPPWRGFNVTVALKVLGSVALFHMFGLSASLVLGMRDDVLMVFDVGPTPTVIQQPMKKNLIRFSDIMIIFPFDCRPASALSRHLLGDVACRRGIQRRF